MFPRRKTRAFSIVDLLVVVAICGVIGGFAVAAFSNVRSDVIDARLQSDVDTINYAVSVFRAKGGNLEGLTDPNAVLITIKKHAEQDMTGNLVHYLGSADQMIDPRLLAVMLTEDELRSKRARAVWDPHTQRFVVTDHGYGVREFAIGWTL